MESAHARRGRPPLIDPAELQQRAIDVVVRHGYAEVTMGTVAAEIGVSLRTLHRHFPSKADLVWGALDGTFEQLGANLAAAAPEAPVFAAIESAIVQTFQTGVESGGGGRERLRLIATTPELQAAQSEAFRRWELALVEFTAARLGFRPDDLVPLAIGAAAQAATMAGLAWWAVSGQEGPASEAVSAALRGVGAAYLRG